MPVAASTFSLLMLSLDRHVTVKDPCIAQIRQHRYLHTMLSCLCWALAILLNIRIFFYDGYNEVANNTNFTTTLNDTTVLLYTLPTSTLQDMDIDIDCRSDYEYNEDDTYFISTHTILVFIIPAIGIFLNHFAVRRTLCIYSLKDMIYHGHVPLPMPTIRKDAIVINAIRYGMEEGSLKEENEEEDEYSIPMVERSLMPQHTLDRRLSFGKPQPRLNQHPMSPR